MILLIYSVRLERTNCKCFDSLGGFRLHRAEVWTSSMDCAESLARRSPADYVLTQCSRWSNGRAGLRFLRIAARVKTGRYLARLSRKAEDGFMTHLGPPTIKAAKTASTKVLGSGTANRKPRISPPGTTVVWMFK